MLKNRAKEYSITPWNREGEERGGMERGRRGGGGGGEGEEGRREEGGRGRKGERERERESNERVNIICINLQRVLYSEYPLQH